ncbi:MAG: hypothetical protein GXP46_03010 [Deferribacteres bacterium]|nr:hypothetical protein [Deferribacteres bacterium]
MIPDQYVWLVWSSAFLIPWLILYLVFPAHRKAMLWAGIFTMPFGLTEPMFVPEYWSPPSLFDLAVNTGFDIESLIFSFGIGGLGAVLYNVLAGQVPRPMPDTARHHKRHRFHKLILASPFIIFPVLYFLPWNPIYPAITGMFTGAVATIWCRPDLKTKTWLGGLLFVGFYVFFLFGLELTAPGYIERVWNLEALSGISIFNIPLEELLFAFSFGMYWSSVYEHITWKRTTSRSRV